MVFDSTGYGNAKRLKAAECYVTMRLGNYTVRSRDVENREAKERLTESYRVIEGGARGEIVEKKSRFIATLEPVSSEQEALDFIESVRRKYYDARHNCFAFIIGKDGKLERCSDDGEPSGTAGRPMLEVLRSAGISEAAAVVTRYFGGTLLGTGGLVRAYTQAMQAAMERCSIVTMRCGIRYHITAEYVLAGKLQYLFARRQIITENTVYTDKVEFYIVVPFREEEALKKDIIELAAARIQLEKTGYTYYVDRDRG